jgi:hypothetical protein
MLTPFSCSLRSCQYWLNWPTDPSVFNVHQSQAQIILQRHQLCCHYSYLRYGLPSLQKIMRSHLLWMCKPPFHQLLHPFLASSSGYCLGVQVREFICVTFVVFKPGYGIHDTDGVKGCLSDGKSLNNLLYKSGCD